MNSKSKSTESDQLGRRLKAISGDIKRYVEKRVELLLLDIGEHFSKMMAESVHKIAGIILLAAASVCLLVALALYLGDLLENDSLGYVLVSIPLLLFGTLFIYLKPRSMLERIQNHFEKEIVKALSVDAEGSSQAPELEPHVSGMDGNKEPEQQSEKATQKVKS